MGEVSISESSVSVVVTLVWGWWQFPLAQLELVSAAKVSFDDVGRILASIVADSSMITSSNGALAPLIKISGAEGKDASV